MKITATALSLLAAVSVVSAGKFHFVKPEASEIVVPNTYIIEYQEGVNHEAARNAINRHKVNFKVKNEYGIFNGATIQVGSDVTGPGLATIPGIKKVWPVIRYQIPKVIEATKGDLAHPTLVSAHNMTGVNVLHDKFKYTGKGVKIGIIDTGIDYKHPALGGCFGKKCRVRYGWDFVGDDYTGYNSPKGDGDPMDCQGHGSHVAGIVGANALNIKGANAPPMPFVGVAPDVTFGAYRVFGCSGSAQSDVIMQAMELAFNEGMHVINMSLGGGSAYKSNPESVLGDALVKKGMAVVAAAGNDGSQGVWMVSNVALGDETTSVASFDNIAGSYFPVQYGSKSYPYSPSIAWANQIDLPASATLVPIFEANGALSDGCDPAIYKNFDVKGKVVLAFGDVTRCKSGGRGTNAQTAGAAGILIQTTPLGIASLGGNAGFPMGSLEHYAGEELIATFKANPKTVLTWGKTKVTFKVEGGGAPSDFSSWGLDGELRQKPDVAGPGGNILSTYPLAKGGYAILSGTSMATPYVVGSHALYIQAKNKLPGGATLRDVFKNTATNSHFAGRESFVPTIKQGAGLINVLAAIQTTTSIKPAKIDLLDTPHFVKSATFTIKNFGKKTETYTLSHQASDSVNSYNAGNSFPLTVPVLQEDHATVKFDKSSVTIKAGASAKVTVQFAEPKTGKASEFPIYSGFITATPKTKGNVAVHVPYAGLKGDVSQVPIQDTDFGVPAAFVVDNASGKELDPVPASISFANQTIYVYSRVGSHTPDLSVRVFDAADKFVGYLWTAEANGIFGPSGRQPDVDSTTGKKVYSTWAWKGFTVADTTSTTTPVKVAAGTYTVKVASQRKLTKGAYPADYEVYTLGKWVIA